MATTKDPFTIKIVMLHRYYSPKRISKALSLKPSASRAIGTTFPKSRAKWTWFYACLQKGNYASGYGRALTKVASLVEMGKWN